MKDTLITLSTAYHPAKSSHRYSYTGEDRINQFVNGYNSFFDNFEKRPETDVCIMDGTIDSLDLIDERVKEIIPPYVNYKLYLKNQYGALNNGAGMIETWKFYEETLKKYKWIIHFEPRTTLRSFDFFNQFYADKRNLFTLDNTGQQFYTGLFSISSTLLLDFSRLDLDKMVRESISIEKILFEYMKDKPKEIIESVGVLWFDKYSASSYYF
jgi:hypothetical protein